MNVWYVHPYAGGPGIGRYWRPFYFSYYWNRSGHRSTVLSASYHHLMEPDEQRRRGTTVDGVNYAYVPTLAYHGNGLGRMFSMLLFAVLLTPVAWCSLCAAVARMQSSIRHRIPLQLSAAGSPRECCEPNSYSKCVIYGR